MKLKKEKKRFNIFKKVVLFFGVFAFVSTPFIAWNFNHSKKQVFSNVKTSHSISNMPQGNFLKTVYSFNPDIQNREEIVNPGDASDGNGPNFSLDPALSSAIYSNSSSIYSNSINNLFLNARNWAKYKESYYIPSEQYGLLKVTPKKVVSKINKNVEQVTTLPGEADASSGIIDATKSTSTKDSKVFKNKDGMLYVGTLDGWRLFDPNKNTYIGWVSSNPTQRERNITFPTGWSAAGGFVFTSKSGKEYFKTVDYGVLELDKNTNAFKINGGLTKPLIKWNVLWMHQFTDTKLLVGLENGEIKIFDEENEYGQLENLTKDKDQIFDSNKESITSFKYRATESFFSWNEVLYFKTIYKDKTNPSISYQNVFYYDKDEEKFIDSPLAPLFENISFSWDRVFETEDGQILLFSDSNKGAGLGLYLLPQTYNASSQIPFKRIYNKNVNAFYQSEENRINILSGSLSDSSIISWSTKQTKYVFDNKRFLDLFEKDFYYAGQLPDEFELMFQKGWDKTWKVFDYSKYKSDFNKMYDSRDDFVFKVEPKANISNISNDYVFANHDYTKKMTFNPHDYLQPTSKKSESMIYIWMSIAGVGLMATLFFAGLAIRKFINSPRKKAKTRTLSW